MWDVLLTTGSQGYSMIAEEGKALILGDSFQKRYFSLLSQAIDIKLQRWAEKHWYEKSLVPCLAWGIICVSNVRNYEIQSLTMLPTKVRMKKDGLNINLLKYLSLLVNSEHIRYHEQKERKFLLGPKWKL